MALVAVAAGKGAPGVTTTALVLALRWPRPAVLAECDPSGADLPLRLTGPGGAPLRSDVGLLPLASAARRGQPVGFLAGQTQPLAGGLPVLVGPPSAERAAALSGLWGTVGAVLAADPEFDVLADCGRLDPAAPAGDLLRAADLVVLVCRARADSVAHLRARLEVLLPQLRAARGRVPAGVLVLADPTRARDATAVRQVAEVLAAAGLDVPVLGQLAWDPAAARQLAGEPGRGLGRSLLLRSGGTAAAELAARVAPVVAA